MANPLFDTYFSNKDFIKVAADQARPRSAGYTDIVAGNMTAVGGTPTNHATLDDELARNTTLFEKFNDGIRVWKFVIDPLSWTHLGDLYFSPNEPTYLHIDNATSNVGTSVGVTGTWYDLTFASATSAASNFSIAGVSDTNLTYDGTTTKRFNIRFQGVANTSAMTGTGGTISIRFLLNETPIAYSEIPFDNPDGVMYMFSHIAEQLANGDVIKVQVSSSAVTGNFAFTHCNVIIQD